MNDIKSANPAMDPIPIPTPTALSCPHDAGIPDDEALLDGHDMDGHDIEVECDCVVVGFDCDGNVVFSLIFPIHSLVTGIRTKAA